MEWNCKHKMLWMWVWWGRHTGARAAVGVGSALAGEPALAPPLTSQQDGLIVSLATLFLFWASGSAWVPRKGGRSLQPTYIYIMDGAWDVNSLFL